MATNKILGDSFESTILDNGQKTMNCMDSSPLNRDFANDIEPTVITCNSTETTAETPDIVIIDMLNDNSGNSDAMFNAKMTVHNDFNNSTTTITIMDDNNADVISIGSTDSSSDEENVNISRPNPTKKVTRRGLNLTELDCTIPVCEKEYPKSAIYSSRILNFSEQKRNVNECLNSLTSELLDDDEDSISVSVEAKQVINSFPQEKNRERVKSDNDVVVTTVSNKRRKSPSPPPPLPKLQVVKKMTKKTRKLLGNIEKNKLLYDASKLLYTSESPVSSEKELLDANSTRAIVAKFRCQGSIFRITMKRNEKFISVLPEVAKRCQSRLSDILLTRNEDTIEVEESPNSIDLSSADIIDCYILNPASNDQNSLTLFIQASDCKAKIAISLNKLSPLSELMEEYAKQRNIPVSNMKFKFDGDLLEPTDTPAELDMQDENCIDVIVSS